MPALVSDLRASPGTTAQPAAVSGFLVRFSQSALAPALAAIAIHTVFLLVFLSAHRGDPSAFVCVGSTRIGQYPYEAVHTAIGDKGFDGAYYYAIARNPWQRHDVGVDLPAVRHARILYPALAWCLTGGDSYALFWVMPAINLLAIGLLGWLGAQVACASGLNVWWGLLLPFAVNAGPSALRDLTDVVSCAALAAVLAAEILNRPAAILLISAVAALFARESNVVFIVAILGAAACRQQWHRVGGLIGVLLLWAAWIVTLRVVYGQWPILPAKENSALPFFGLAYGWSYLGGSASKFGAVFNSCCLLVLMSQLVLAAVLIRDRTDLTLVLTALAATVMALTAGEAIYCDRWSYMRVFAPLPLALWIGFARAGRKRLMWILSAPVVIFAQAAFAPWLTTV